MATDQGVGGSNPLTHVKEKGVRTNVLAPFCSSPVGPERVRSTFHCGQRQTDVPRTSSALSRTVEERKRQKKVMFRFRRVRSDQEGFDLRYRYGRCKTDVHWTSSALSRTIRDKEGSKEIKSCLNIAESGRIRLAAFLIFYTLVLIFSYTGSGKYFVHF